jgi:hypothetical protein
MKTLGRTNRADAPQVARPARGLGLIPALYALTATSWAWLNPVFEAPDEPFHVANVNLLLREHRWPDEADIGADSARAWRSSLGACSRRVVGTGAPAPSRHVVNRRSW